MIGVFHQYRTRPEDDHFAFGWEMGRVARSIALGQGFANPYGGQNGYGNNDPGAPGTFGCGCATPDIAAANPAVGSGGPRSVQLGLKFTF